MTLNTGLCECGCGQSVKRRFVKGHQLRVSNPMQWASIRKKASNSKRGRRHSLAHRLRISAALKGRITWNTGLTKETDLRIAAMSEKVRLALKGRVRLPEEVAKTAESNRGKRRSPEFCARMSEKTRAHMSLPGVRELKSRRMKERWEDPLSIFQDPVWRQEWARRRGLRPSKPEMELARLIAECGLPFKYVGDWQVLIGRKNPDFINVNGKKQVIELYGDYWHQGQDPADRVAVFAEYGFDTLVVWQHELKEPDTVISRLKEFAA